MEVVVERPLIQVVLQVRQQHNYNGLILRLLPRLQVLVKLVVRGFLLEQVLL